MSILRKNARPIRILEQIIEDPVSGLTIQFVFNPNNGTSRLRLFGDIPYGNREFIFNAEGQEAGAGVALAGLCDLPSDDSASGHCTEADDHE